MNRLNTKTYCTSGALNNVKPTCYEVVGLLGKTKRCILNSYHSGASRLAEMKLQSGETS